MSRVVVVAGGSAGIGRATAEAFAKEGAAVAVLARDEGRLRDCAEALRALHARALCLSADVAEAAQVETAAAHVERELGPIDVWVNNAMVTVFAPFGDITPEEFRRVTEVTYLGTVNGTRAALARMRTRNAGCIVQVGSALAYRSIPLQSAYCGAKAAIRAFSDALRSELIHEDSGIRVTMVQLCAFNTPQFDWGRSHLPRRLQPVPPILQPEIAAHAIVRASRGTRREWWVGWPTVRTILSTRLLPGALGDRLAAALAYEQQMTAEADDPERPHNLFQPVPGRRGAHGRFDGRARAWSAQPWLSAHRLGIAIAMLALVGAAGFLVL